MIIEMQEKTDRLSKEISIKKERERDWGGGERQIKIVTERDGTMTKAIYVIISLKISVQKSKILI